MMKNGFKSLLLFVIGILFGISFCMCIIYINNVDVDVFKNDVQRTNNNFVAMMVETDANSKKYVQSSSNEWLTDGYVFNSTLSGCENGGVISWDDVNKKIVMESNCSDKCYVYFDVYVAPAIPLSEYVLSMYSGEQVNNGLYYHNISLTNGAGDNSYRYAGANPNNYVCFGSSEDTCPADNLYRIIGVINGKTKLISAYGATTEMLGTDGGYSRIYDEDTSSYKGLNDVSKIGVYYWNSTSTNTWSTSTFNTINLNTNYISYLRNNSSDWNYMIDKTTWYVGGLSVNNAMYSNAKNVYNYEVGASKDTSTTVTSKIGLMYLSEYYYGAIPKYWTLPGYNSSGNDYSKAYNDNWMNQGLYEWTISRNSSGTPYSFHVYLDGEVAQSSVSVSHAVRPTFNLTEAVIYFSGSGTISDPVRLDYMH